MSRCVAMRRNAYHRPVLEDIVLAVDHAYAVPVVVIIRVVVDLVDQIVVVPSLPLATLNQQRRIRELLVASAVIEVEMGVDDESDLAGENAQRLEPCSDF